MNTTIVRTTLAAMLLALAVCFGALSALGAPAGSTSSDESARPYVYYRCYVQGYGWMYCTDAAHS